MLGTREAWIYGKESLASINERLGRIAKRGHTKMMHKEAYVLG